MVDVIWADRFGREKGYVGKVAGDFTIGTENTFALKVESSVGISQDCYLMIDGTEYGGIVDGVEIDTSADYVTVSGRTFGTVCSPAASSCPTRASFHYTVSGDLNAVLGELAQRLGLWERMAADESASGISVSNWKFSASIVQQGRLRRALLRHAAQRRRQAANPLRLRAAQGGALGRAARRLHPRRPGRRAGSSTSSCAGRAP